MEAQAPKVTQHCSVPFTHHNAPGLQAGLPSKLHYMAPEVGRKMTGCGALTPAQSPTEPHNAVAFSSPHGTEGSFND